MPARPLSADDISAPSLWPVSMPQDLQHCAKINAMAVFQGVIYLNLTVDFEEIPAVWRFDPVTLNWQSVLGPGVLADSQAGQYEGFTGMAVFQGTRDAAPCLYVTTQSLSGARLLRSTDGLSFEAVLTAPMTAGYLGLTALTVWDNRLVMTSDAHLPGHTNGHGTLPPGTVLGSRNPGAADQWELLSDPGFGDPDNTAISALAVHEGKLYAGTNNPAAGFQIWVRATDAGQDASAWTCVMDQGAARHGMNAQVAMLASHHGHLWIGTATDAPELDILDWPAAELLRIEPDGVWELIAGEARLTPQGLRLPLSLLGPGLEDPGVTRLGTMAALPDALMDGALLLGGGPLAGLWLSQDGEEWEPVLLQDGVGETTFGVTAMALTTESLWIAIDGKLYTLGAAT